MKKKEEKEVISLAKISFLKNGFFAAASVMVMVMAVVVVLFAVSAAPASAQPVMNFSFFANTGGNYPPDQIYFTVIGRSKSLGGKPYPDNNYGHVDKSGKLIEISTSDNTVTVPGYTGKYANYCYNLSEVSSIPVPLMYSGRVYISLGTPIYLQINGPDAYAGPDLNNSAIPGFKTYYDKVEFTLDLTGPNNSSKLYCNPTQVDFVGIPMTQEVTVTNGTTFPKAGITESRKAIFDAFKRDMPSKFQGLFSQSPYRIVAPFHGQPNQYKNLTNYFDDYVNAVWEYYNASTGKKLNFTTNEGNWSGQVINGVFTFSKNGGIPEATINKPDTINISREVFGCDGVFASGDTDSKIVQKWVVAALNRHVILREDPANWCNNTTYYKEAPANYYAQFWHHHCIDNKAYGFGYDDICDQSPSGKFNKPKELKINISFDWPKREKLNCSCGDICVNTNGWWRNGKLFNETEKPILTAVDHANVGETICVKDGTYKEAIDVTKRLTIQSENGSVATIVKAPVAIDQIFNVTADYVNISGFTVKDAPGGPNGAGIHVKADNCNISYNNATNNYYGIIISSSSKFNTLMKNTASNNTPYGIYVENSSNNSLANNFVNLNNPNGIYLKSSSHNTLTGNTVSNSDFGIRMMVSSNYNTLTGNHIVNPNTWGIYMDSSTYDNHIYNNYFKNTGGTAGNAYFEAGGRNIWNTTKTAGTNIVGGPYLGGNYWCDYTGKDLNGDGLGDTPYTNIIPPGPSNKDYLPLVVIPVNFTVNLSAHWNGLSLPLNDSSVTNASSLAAKIGVNCKEVLGWDSAKQKYVPYIPEKPLHNFDIRAGEGCMVNLKNPTTVVFTGKGWTSPFTIQLAQKYTALSAPVKDSTITKASSLVTKIGGCKLIAKWDSAKQMTVCYRPHSGGDIHPPGGVCSSTEDFDITGGDAYFVYVSNPTKVTFVGVPWHD